MCSCQERSLKYDQYEEIHWGAGKKHVPRGLIYFTGLPPSKERVKREPKVALSLFLTLPVICFSFSLRVELTESQITERDCACEILCIF